MFIYASYKFLEHLRSIKNASDHTIRNYSIDLNNLKIFLEKELLPDFNLDQLPDKIRFDRPYSLRNSKKDNSLPLKNINRSLLRRYLAQMNERNDNRATINRRISSLRTFFKFAVVEGFIHENPIEELEPPRLDKRLPLTLSYQQVLHLLGQPPTSNYLGFRDRVIMELFYSSGLRVSELCALNREDFFFDELLLKLHGKGRKERLVPITKNAAEWIKSYLNHPERHSSINGHLAETDPKAIFLNKLGTRLTTRSVDRKFDLYLKMSGLAGKATPHTIRHTIATHWFENGMGLETIKELLGHTRLSTTTIYTQASTKRKKEAYDSTRLFE